MDLIDNAVPLAGVARVCKTTAAKLTAEAHALSLFVGEDWSRAPAVSPADARELRTGEDRRRADHDVRWQAHLAEARAWEQSREHGVAVASRVAYEDVRGRGEGDPAAGAAGRKAGARAGQQYEAQNPPPVFDKAGNSAAVRRFDEPSSALRRVAERMRAAVASTARWSSATAVQVAGSRWSGARRRAHRANDVRAAWVRQKVTEHGALTAPAKLAAKAGPLLSILRSADRDTRCDDPGSTAA